MKKRILVLTVAVMLSFISVFTAGCTEIVEDLNENQTQLYVANYNGGVGEKWLDNAVKAFEEKYADKSFEEGKTGVQVIIDHSKSYDGLQLTNTLATDTYEVYFTNGANYQTYVGSGLFYDITDVITERKGDDGKTIESKMFDVSKDAMKVNGKYYAIPFYELYTGLQYDAAVLRDNNLYFADKEDTADEKYVGTSAFVVNKSSKKSCGPDGVYDTYDDGLPSSYAEFYKLVDAMVTRNIDAFVWTGKSFHYTNMFLQALIYNYDGVVGHNACYNFDTKGEKLEVVTGFNGDNPVIESVAVTKDNGYLAKQTAGTYYAFEFLSKIFSNKDYYYTNCTSTTYSHLNAMESLMNSGLNGTSDKRIAFLMDGSWWYNEATDDGIFERLDHDHPDWKESKEPLTMPLPHQYSGRVTEGKGSNPVVSNMHNSYAFINANIEKNRPEHIEVAKTFLSFMYDDAQLVNFTKDTNGTVISVNYDYSSVLSSLPAYSQSVLKLREEAVKNGTYICSISSDSTWVNNYKKFDFNDTACWSSTVGDYCVNAFREKNPPTVKEFFEGLWISPVSWDSMK